MTYEDSLSALNAKAAEVEAMEGTRSYCYTLMPEDINEYTVSALRRFFIVMIAITLLCVALLIFYVVRCDYGYIAMFATCIVVFGLFALFMLFCMLRSKKRNANNQAEVKLSVNSYGIVMRTVSQRISSVYVLAYTDFDNIVEYKKVVVGLRQGLAYVIPKRIFSQEEFDIFRRFSYASIGKRCAYKNFNP